VTQTQKDPLSAAEVRRMVEGLRPGLIGLRDQALLLPGYLDRAARRDVHARIRREIGVSKQLLHLALRKLQTNELKRAP